MVVTELGAKHTCAACESRFFDLHKKPAVCPKCGTICKVVVRSNVRRVRKASTRVLDGGDLLIQHMADAKAQNKGEPEEEAEAEEPEEDEAEQAEGGE